MAVVSLFNAIFVPVIMRQYTILYIHGMGGGETSRIPNILKDNINGFAPEDVHIDVVVRKYDIDPEIAWPAICGWVEELRPQLVIGESLGSLHALRIEGVPHIFVSPSVGASRWMSIASYIPGAALLMRLLFKPIAPERQQLRFTQRILSHYRGIRRQALSRAPVNGGKDYFFAFFGTKDAYRRSGIVCVRKWRERFGFDSCAIYDGTHYMEEEYLYSMLIPKILEVLGC